ncbi:MAG TPA: MFS transporter [Nocardioides sp.]|nr:MFS transporter [Nocardioides sp.]
MRLLVAARVVDRLGGFTLAFLPLLLVASYGASLRTAGLVGAAFGVATIPSRLLGGRLADRLGRRTTIVLGLCGCAAAQAVLAVAPGLPLALVGAVALGLCFEVYEPPSQALLADLTPPDQRAAAYSALGAALAGAAVVAGLLAALLAGAGLRWLFAADAATCLACALVVRLLLPAAGTVEPHRPQRRARPWRDPRLRAMLVAGTGFATVYLTMLVGLPLALHDQHAAPAWAGVLVAVSAVTVIGGRRLRLTRATDPFARMRTGYTLLAVGLALAALAAGASALTPDAALPGAAYLLPVVVWSLGDVVLLGEPFAVVAGLAPDAERGRYLAAYGVSWGVATTLAPVLAAGLLARGGPTLLWGACAAVAGVLAVTLSRVRTAVTRR